MSENTKSGPLLPSAWIDIHLNWEATQAALKDYEDFENFYKVETIAGQKGGFVLGTPSHRGDNGVGFWINAQTGQGTLWSKSNPPHPSPAHDYFWETPGSRFVEIGKRPNGTPMTEGVQSLYVASYANPAQLLPVVTGSAFVYSADWLPDVATPERKPKP